jgi:hypothetical protein
LKALLLEKALLPELAQRRPEQPELEPMPQV